MGENRNKSSDGQVTLLCLHSFSNEELLFMYLSDSLTSVHDVCIVHKSWNYCFVRSS